MLALFPGGFEEVDKPAGVELVAYTDAAGEERLWHVFGGARSTEVAGDWETRWRAFHKPVRIGPLWVGPPWEEPPAEARAVIVDPGRAFGTGAHPTTRLCLELLLEAEPGPLLDVGCGSGVLAIAAGLLGFGPVGAVDVEEAAVEAARANAEANGVEIDPRLVGRDETLGVWATAVANITPAAVRELPARVDAAVLITSGYLAAETISLEGYASAERRVRDGWAADLHRKLRG
jgi:ribosomal protein L11 methyltransferase